MSKNCINCGAELSDNAAFCPHCETKQTEKQTIKVPKPWRKCAVTIGLYFNSEKCPFSNAEYDNNTFAGNDIGILLESVPETQTLRFPGTSFTDNGEDIKNLCQQELDTDLALFQ